VTIDSWIAKAAREIDAGRAGDVARIIAKHCPFKPDTAYVEVVRQEPGHVYDWAARAAERIAASERTSSVHRLAAVITLFAEPLTNLLRSTRRPHNDSDDGYCKKLLTLGGPDNFRSLAECTCGADEWNKKVDEALS